MGSATSLDIPAPDLGKTLTQAEQEIDLLTTFVKSGFSASLDEFDKADKTLDRIVTKMSTLKMWIKDRELTSNDEKNRAAYATMKQRGDFKYGEWVLISKEQLVARADTAQGLMQAIFNCDENGVYFVQVGDENRVEHA